MRNKEGERILILSLHLTLLSCIIYYKNYSCFALSIVIVSIYKYSSSINIATSSSNLANGSSFLATGSIKIANGIIKIPV